MQQGGFLPGDDPACRQELHGEMGVRQLQAEKDREGRQIRLISQEKQEHDSPGAGRRKHTGRTDRGRQGGKIYCLNWLAIH